MKSHKTLPLAFVVVLSLLFTSLGSPTTVGGSTPAYTNRFDWVHATAQTPLIFPDFKWPWDSKENGAIKWTSGPHSWSRGGVLAGKISASRGSGLDFAKGGASFDVLSMASGTVITNTCGFKGLGCIVAIKHDVGGSVMIYAHMLTDTQTTPFKPVNDLVAGQWYSQSTVVGHASNSGGPWPIHLHIELRDGADHDGDGYTDCYAPANTKDGAINGNDCGDIGFAGNPVGWDGRQLVNGYYVNGYFDYQYPPLGNGCGPGADCDTIFNYDGSAVKNSMAAPYIHFPYLDGANHDIPRYVEAFVYPSFTCNSTTNCEIEQFDPITGITITVFADHGRFSGGGGVLYSTNSAINPPPLPGDITPPSGYFTSPADGTIVYSPSANIAVNASDDFGGSGVREVRFSAMWSGTWHGIGVDYSAPYLFKWDMCAAGVPDGDVELGMEVWDSANNQWVYSEHYPNPHITKNYGCTLTPPQLAYLNGSILILNIGSEERRNARTILTDEINEEVVVKQLSANLPGEFSVTAFGVTQVYTGVTQILADSDDGNDIISLEPSVGNAANSIAFAFTAPAEINGGNGDDQIQSGDGADTLSGGSGNDEISGGGGNDAIVGDGGNDDLRGGGGSDTINSGPGDDHIEGDGGDDFLYGDETLACDAAGFILNAGSNASASTPKLAGPYVIYLGLVFNNASPNQPPATGAGGSDEINGGLGNDHIFGGGQDDTLNGNDGNDEICGNGGNDTLHGDAGDDAMHGGFGDDYMEGNNGADTMHGNDGNDEMHGQAGLDKMYGDARGDLMNGGAGDDYMEGNDGADGMLGDDGNDEMYGGGDRDMMYGNAGDDVMHGGAGEDYMEGNDGADTMHGDDGNDEMHGQADADEMYGDGDRDTMYGNVGNDMMHGGSGDDYIEGNPDADTMYGDEGQDDMIGGTPTAGMLDGQDTMYGGADHDVMVGDNASITRPLNGGQWIRNTFSASAADVVRRTSVLFDVATTSSNPSSGAYGNDQMYGEGGADIMYGQGGNDTMSGGPNEDYLEGNAGSDTMRGDAGQDDMIGGTGRINDDSPQGVNGRLDGDDQMYGESDASAGTTHGDGADVMLGDNGIITRPLDANGAWQVRSADGAFVRVVMLLDVETLTDSVEPAVHGGDTMWGNDNDDTLYGQGGEDQMHGGAGDDYMEGNAASDLIFGDGGDDDMLGGTGPITSNDPATALLGRIDASTLTRIVSLGDNPAVTVPFGDRMYGGEGSDIMLGDNGIITRPVDEEGQWMTLNYLLFEDTIGDVAPRHTTSGNGARADRRVQFLDLEAGLTAGSDLMYGGPGEDDMYGQFDDTNHSPAHLAIGDEMHGEEGEDAMAGDLGVVTSRVITGETQTIRPPEPFIDDVIFVHGTLFRQVTLLQIETGGDDRMLGGPGGDWIHGGAGNDLMNGNSGNDRLLGGNGVDVLWGGPHHDHLWGGYGDDYLDVKPRQEMIVGNGRWDRGKPRLVPADPLEWFAFGSEDNFQNIDYIYGGWDQDAMQADVADTGPVPGDRLIDWVGAYNVYYLCPGLYGDYVVTRDHSPHMVSFLQDLAAGDGAVDTAIQSSSGFNEIAMVFSRDVQQNSHPPHLDNPGHFTCDQTR